jgi:hypothetical protein
MALNVAIVMGWSRCACMYSRLGASRCAAAVRRLPEVSGCGAHALFATSGCSLATKGGFLAMGVSCHAQQCSAGVVVELAWIMCVIISNATPQHRFLRSVSAPLPESLNSLSARSDFEPVVCSSIDWPASFAFRSAASRLVETDDRLGRPACGNQSKCPFADLNTPGANDFATSLGSS